MKPKTIELRAHTERIERRNAYKITNEQSPDKWSRSALVLDCETTLDQRQCLTFGCYRYCRLDPLSGSQRGKNGYKTVEEGLFYADDTDCVPVATLRKYGESRGVRVLSRSQFVRNVFWKAMRAEALIVGFNLPFDLSRLALEGCWTTRRGGAWSLTMSQYRDRATGKMREDKFRPRIIITPKDGKGSFFRLANSRIKTDTEFPQIRCVDLKTLFWALFNKSHTLDSACKDRGIPGKLKDHKPTGRVSVEEIEYNRQDGSSTVGLLNNLKEEFDRHPISLRPDCAFSPASIAKSYLTEMGILPPSEKFRLSPKLHGIAMQSYYGGRVECRIRRISVPVVYMDFMSEYPTVNTLMGLWRFLVAKRVRTTDITAEIRKFLERVTLERAFDPQFWKELTFFALVEPSEDILPVRARYNENNSNIGLNPLTSQAPIWYAGPDIVASVLLTGKVPKIIKAIRVVPQGTQTGLHPIHLRGAVEVDPSREDFFRKVIESRFRIKSDKQMPENELPENERKALVYFLKIMANAGSYGLFVELNPEKIRSKAKKNRERIRVCSGNAVFETSSETVETPGQWYCPIFASLIPSAGRLLLAMLERSVTDSGGSYAICDTDSMAVVASGNGELIACPGGNHRLPDGREAIKALTWADACGLSEKFSRLNPYDRDTVTTSILKIEDVNFVDFDSSKSLRQVLIYSISSKRYALFTQTDNGIQIEKASGHGLGFLYQPKPGVDEKKEAPIWVVEAWDWLLRKSLNLSFDNPEWLNLPAMRRIVIRTPEILKALQERQKRLLYRDRTKCFNFVSSPILDKFSGYPAGIDKHRFSLVAPIAPDSSDWRKIAWVNIYDGKRYWLVDTPDSLSPNNLLRASTYGDVAGQYTRQFEAKCLGPDGNSCRKDTTGLLQRMPVVAAKEFRFIGKETNRKWEEEEDISRSIVDSQSQEYRPEETKHMVSDSALKNEMDSPLPVSDRELSKITGVNRETIRAIRKGKRVRKSTAIRIWIAVQNIRKVSVQNIPLEKKQVYNDCRFRSKKEIPDRIFIEYVQHNFRAGLAGRLSA
jgi:hypothetical protein